MGVGYAASRSYLATLIPTAESGRFFGLYIFSERFASIVGPLLWSAIVYFFASYYTMNYRYAFFTMGALVLIAAIPLWRAPAQAQHCDSKVASKEVLTC